MEKNKKSSRELDYVDRMLLNELQAHFPIDREPFAILGLTLGISEREVIDRVKRLKEALSSMQAHWAIEAHWLQRKLRQIA